MKIFCCFILISSFMFINADTSYPSAIHLKSGRIIETERCWEENGNICYVKSGNTIRIDQSLIDKVVYDNIQKKKDSTIYFKDGHSEYCIEITIDDNKVTCGKGHLVPFFSKDDIATILNGKVHSFLDLPESAQKKYGLVTVFFKNRDPLLADTSWKDGDKLYCNTSSGHEVFDIVDIENVIRGNLIKDKNKKQTNNSQDSVKVSDKITYFKLSKGLISLKIPLRIGQDKDSVYKYTGEPKSVDKANFENITNSEGWIFKNGSLVFHNGRLKTIRQSNLPFN